MTPSPLPPALTHLEPVHQIGASLPGEEEAVDGGQRSALSIQPTPAEHVTVARVGVTGGAGGTPDPRPVTAGVTGVSAGVSAGGSGVGTGGEWKARGVRCHRLTAGDLTQRHGVLGTERGGEGEGGVRWRAGRGRELVLGAARQFWYPGVLDLGRRESEM